MRYCYIVAIGGIGQRMKLNMPKQFMKHNDKPIFIHTLEKISKNNLVTDVIVVTNANYVIETEKLIAKYNIKKINKIVIGGKSRQESVFNALKEIKYDCIVAIQDGVRINIKSEYIEKSYNVLLENENIDGVVVGVKAKDTIKIINEDNFINKTLKRDQLICAQTPQTFRMPELIEYYKKSFEDKLIVTDDSSIMEAYAKRIIYIDGDYNNIKITTVEDLNLLKL